MHRKANMQATYLGARSKLHHHSVTAEEQTSSVTYTSLRKLSLFYLGSLTQPQCPTPSFHVPQNWYYHHIHPQFYKQYIVRQSLTSQLRRGSHDISTVLIYSDNYVATPCFSQLWASQWPKQRRHNTYSYTWHYIQSFIFHGLTLSEWIQDYSAPAFPVFIPQCVALGFVDYTGKQYWLSICFYVLHSVYCTIKDGFAQCFLGIIYFYTHITSHLLLRL